MQFLVILALVIIGLIYKPVETVVICVGITLIGWIRQAVKMKEKSEYRAKLKGSHERLTNANYVEPRWYSSPWVIYPLAAAIIALLIYFY